MVPSPAIRWGGEGTVQSLMCYCYYICMVVVGWCRSLVAEHWRLKPEALGSIPGGTTFLSFPLPFQRSSDSNGLDNLYRSSDLGEPHLSGSQCCDDTQDSFVITNTRSNYHLISTKFGTYLLTHVSAKITNEYTRC